MKKLIPILFVMIMCSLGYSRNNNSALSVPNKRTYWALTKSVCYPQWNMIERGIYFGPDSLFDWYQITNENDTLSLGDGMDWNINIDHRSYWLNEDTLFIKEWEIDGCCTPRPEPYDTIPHTVEAYKILYVTKQKLLLLDLTKDSLSRWVEYRTPKCDELNVLEFDNTQKK